MVVACFSEITCFDVTAGIVKKICLYLIRYVIPWEIIFPLSLYFSAMMQKSNNNKLLWDNCLQPCAGNNSYTTVGCGDAQHAVVQLTRKS